MSDPQKSGPTTDSPLVKLMVSMTGASGAEHESEPPGANLNALKAGHEADKFGVKGIVLVPVFVALVLAITYGIVTVTFNAINKPPAAERSVNSESEVVIKRNAASTNDRFAMTNSVNPKELDGKVVPQPRLEYLKQTEGNDPSNYRSKLPLPTGNSPEIHPEDLRQSRYIDPATRRKLLNETGWVVDDKIAHIPIDKAMEAVLKKLPVRKDPVAVSGTSDGRAKQSNAGRGGPSQPIAAPEVPAAKKDH